jgi:hypothetical protein
MAGAPESRPSYPPHESDDGPSDIKMDADDMREDQDPDVPQTSTANIGSYACFLADLPNWSDLSQSDYTKAFEALPRPLPSSAPPGLSIHEAIQARNTTYRYCIYKYHARYHSQYHVLISCPMYSDRQTNSFHIMPVIIQDIVPDIRPDVIQDGLVPPLEKEAAGIISSSDEILKAQTNQTLPHCTGNQ